MSRKSLVFKLWPKNLLTNQIAQLLFQTLTKNGLKEFSEFLHDDSEDDSLPSRTNCMSRKSLVLKLKALGQSDCLTTFSDFDREQL